MPRARNCQPLNQLVNNYYSGVANVARPATPALLEPKEPHAVPIGGNVLKTKKELKKEKKEFDKMAAKIDKEIEIEKRIKMEKRIEMEKMEAKRLYAMFKKPKSKSKPKKQPADSSTDFAQSASAPPPG